MTIVWFAFWVGLLYLGVVLLMWLLQDRFIYFPDRESRGDPGQLGYATSDVIITTDDDIRLHGWHIRADGSRYTVLFFHGNAGNITDRLPTIRVLHELGLSLLIFDYRGYGRSEGSPSEAGLQTDARAAWRHLVAEERTDPGRIIIWGRSLGGAVAAYLAAEVQPAGLVVESSFTSAGDLARRIYPWLPVKLLLRARYDAASQVAHLTCPKLFMHSPEDDVVPYDLGVRLFEAAAEPKRLVDLQGDHNSGFSQSLVTYRQAVSRFLDELSNPR